MNDEQRTTTSRLEIDGNVYVLAPGQELTDLMRSIEDAARYGPSFVQVRPAPHATSVLISEHTRVIASTDAVGPGPPLLEPPDPGRPEWEYEG